MSSKFIEIFDAEEPSMLMRSDSDVRLEDVLADHEAVTTRPRSSTQSSSKSKSSIENSPSHRWKRLSSMLGKR